MRGQTGPQPAVTLTLALGCRAIHPHRRPLLRPLPPRRSRPQGHVEYLPHRLSLAVSLGNMSMMATEFNRALAVSYNPCCAGEALWDAENELVNPGTPMLESVLAMLVEEVKELRHTTQQLRDEHMLLANEVAALQQRQAEHEAKSNLIGRNNPFNSTHFAHAQDYSSSSEGSPFAILNTGAQSAYPRMGQNHSRSFLAPTDSSDSPDSISPLTSTTSISPTQQPSILSHFHPQKTYPQTSSTVMPRQTLSSPSTNSTAPTLCTRREIINYLPFLSSYPINNLDAPFAIDDLAKPFAAVRRVSGVPGEWEHSPPIFVFANTAFCAMVKYPLVPLQAPSVDHRALTLHYTRSPERTFGMPLIESDVPG